MRYFQFCGLALIQIYSYAQIQTSLTLDGLVVDVSIHSIKTSKGKLLDSVRYECVLTNLDTMERFFAINGPDDTTVISGYYNGFAGNKVLQFFFGCCAEASNVLINCPIKDNHVTIKRIKPFERLQVKQTVKVQHFIAKNLNSFQFDIFLKVLRFPPYEDNSGIYKQHYFYYIRKTENIKFQINTQNYVE